MKHGSGVKQLPIEHQALSLPGQGSPKVDPSGMVKQQFALGIPNELRYLLGHLAVRNRYAVNIVSRQISLLRKKVSDTANG